MKKFSAKNSSNKTFLCTVAKAATTDELQMVCVAKVEPEKSAEVQAPRQKVSTKKASITSKSSRKITQAARKCPGAASTQCISTDQILVASTSLQKPCFTFNCDVTVNIQSLVINKILIKPSETLISPFEVVPPLNPPSDVKCPDTPIGGDPLQTSIIDQDAALLLDWLILTNDSDTPTRPSPKASAGPWYFEKEPFSTSGKTVLTVGCRETFDPTSTRDDERFPPHQSDTRSIIDITFDASQLDPKTAKVSLDLSLGYSSEANYDFFTVYVDGVVVFRGSGPGIDAEDPYRTADIVVIANINSIVTVEYFRDPAVYGGVDSGYFTINQAIPIIALEFPTSLQLLRGTTILKDYGALIDLDSQTANSLTVDCTIHLLPGDRLCLNADPGVYSQYNATISYQNIPQIYDHRYDEIFRGEVEFNAIKYNNRIPKSTGVIGGWYNTDDQFSQNLIFIEEVSGCPTGGPAKLRSTNYSLASSGPYFVNSYWSPGVITMTEIDPNTYQDDASGYVYIFDPLTGDFRLDTSDPDNLPRIGNTTMTILKQIKNADERYWQYQFDLTDPDHEFNPPTKFFEFVGQYYKAGQISSQFGTRSVPTWPEINPLQLDQTQVQASYGVVTKAEYDDLFRRLKDIGIKREYRIQRWIYWPYPAKGNGTKAVHPKLTAAQKKELRWVVNINRYPYLAFVPYVPDEGEHVYPKLCPGETVKLCGTGTRLDGFPLRLAMDGYHTGPKPGPEFMQTYSGVDPRNGRPIPRDQEFNIFKEWSYYTLRLPIIIDSSNNTIYSRGGGIGRFGTPPHFITVIVSGADLGPYQAIATLFGQNIAIFPLGGHLVLPEPLNASTPFTNPEEIAGNVIIVLFETGVSPGSGTIIARAVEAGATGVIFVDPDQEDLDFPGFGAAGAIPSIQVSTTAGPELIAALEAGQTIAVDVSLDSPIHKTVLPSGIFYLTDLLQQLFDAYVAGESEFYIEVGNFIAGYYGYNDIFALGGTAQAILFGPDDSTYPSNFFGPKGLDIAYLWGNTPDTPLVNEVQFQSAEFYDGTYAQLQPGQYKTHTPLTSAEAQALIDSLKCDLTIPVGVENNNCRSDKDAITFKTTDNTRVTSKTVCNSDNKSSKSSEKKTKNGKKTCRGNKCLMACPTVSATHGPVTYDMTYEKFVACIQELSAARGTEDHNIIFPWVYKSDNGLYELPINMQTLLDKLKTIFIDPTVTYAGPFNDIDGLTVDPESPSDPPIPGVPISATWAPTVYAMPLRLIGVGHGGELSEMYNATYERRHTEDMSRGEGRLEWIVPRWPEIFNYPEDTVLPIIGDISLREVEIPVVNYLEDPQWLTFGKMADGAPDYGFIPFREHTAVDEEALEPWDIFSPIAVRGSWLVGVLKDSKVRSILNLPVTEAPPRYGYITWYTSEWASDGDSSLLPWYDPNFVSVDQAAAVAAARILQYFNENQVKHIIIDVRGTVGGSEPFWQTFSSLIGGERFYGANDVIPVMSLEPNGTTSVRTSVNFQVALEEAGAVEYKFRETILQVSPDAFVEGGLLDLIPGGIWNGEVTGQAALGLKSNIIWMSSATTISNPQFQLLSIKATSIDQTTYDGNFGRSTQFVHYGIYDRPFSTGGGYESYLNWWTRGRTGEEENPVGLMMGIDRWDGIRYGYMQGNVNGKGGVLKGMDQEFGALQQPHIKWDMNATVFMQDIGFTVGNPGVIPEIDGEPWVPTRYSDVIFGQPLTYRDSILERVVQMANDPDLESHFYQEDGYGYVTQLPI